MYTKEKLDTKENIKKKILMFPMIMAQLYLIGVIVLYQLGPWEWPTRNALLFYLLIFFYQLFFGLGYLIAIKKNISIRKIEKKNIYNFLSIMIVINLIFVIFNFMHTVGISSFSVDKILDSFINGIQNPSSQYQMKFNVEKFGGSYFTYFSVLAAPIMWPVFPLSFFYFKELNSKKKLIVAISLFFEVARWVATGTSKGIIDLMVILLVVTVAKYMRKRISDDSKKIINYKKYRFGIIMFTILIIGVLFFSNNVGDRVNQNWSDYSTTNGNVPINQDSFLMKITPDNFKPTLIYLTSYLTQGYYAFSMSLDLNFQPMFGIGNSMFLIENINELFGLDLYEQTYQSRMSAFGWDPYVNWHSFYVWVANDVHFIGVTIIMFLLGYLLGITYKSVLLNNDSVALVLLSLTTLIIIYIPANNQVLSYPTTFLTFWILLIYWNLRKKYKFVF
ncbi:O-antigen polymerase [Carnobacterium alterfunditum]|uniref:O-antigen polymerase n=1 Tax=Carnobacterium alterfunditum TaxID=28230 RepID=UPI0035940DC6